MIRLFSSTLWRAEILIMLFAMVPASALAEFTNVAAAAGISVTDARGAGWADYDQDGCLDLMVVTGTGPLLFKSNCNGTFTDVSGAAGMPSGTDYWAVAWGDFDNDDDLDAYVTNAASLPNPLLKNNGNGTFTDISGSAFTGLPGSTAGASWSDIDGDGDLDLFIANRFGGDRADKLYRNNGDATFTDVTVAAGLGGNPNRKTFMGAWFDYDTDGDQDLWLAVDFGDDVLYQNNGSGIFADVSATAGISEPQHGMGVYFGDMNADGCLDVFSSNNHQVVPEPNDHGPSALYINNCDGTFTYASATRGLLNRGVVEWGGNLIDFDNDGDQDLSVVAGGMLSSGEPNVLYETDCGGDFCDLHVVTSAQGVSNSGASFGSAWSDFDDDGDLDWFVANAKGGNSALLRNDGPTGNYLKVKLDGNGVTNNTYGVGARIELVAGGLYQQRTINAGISYVSSEELVAMFGLGQKTSADTLLVTWPDGTISELSDVTANQTITVSDDDPVTPTTCMISGTTYDPDGAPYDSLVRLFDEDARTRVGSYSSGVSGLYSFSEVPVGHYSVIANAKGFRRSSRSEVIDCQAGRQVVIDLHLRVSN